MTTSTLLVLAGLGVAAVVGVMLVMLRGSGASEPSPVEVPAEPEPAHWREGLPPPGAPGRLDALLLRLRFTLESRLGGELARQDDGAGTTLRATLEGRPLIVRIEELGEVALELEADTGGHELVLRWGTPDTDDTCARRDIGKGVFLQEPRELYEARLAVWESLAGSDAANGTLSGMRRHEVRELRIEAGTLALIPHASILRSSVENPEEEIVDLVNLLAIALRMVRLAEKATEDSSDDARLPATLAERLRDYGDMSSDWARRDAAIGPLLEALAANLDESKVILPSAHDDACAEVRGDRGALRLITWVTEDGAWAARTQTQSPHCVHLAYDPDKQPVSPDAEGRDDDPIRVFVAEGLYIEGDERQIDLYGAWCASLPPGHLDELAERFASIPLRWVSHGTVGELAIEAGTLIHELPDPLASVRALQEVAVWLGETLGPGEGRSVVRTHCGYCRAEYFFGPHREACPNCGAPAETLPLEPT